MSLELRESSSFEKSSHRTEGGKFIVAGQFSKADLRNENGRVYRKSMWENVLRRPYIVDALQKRKMLGELGHPDKIETTPLNVSHIVTKLELRPDGEVYGEAEILDTPSGKVLKTLYEAGVTMGISSRGYLPEGSNLYAEGEDLIVPDDYELVTFDFVIDPSSQGACPTVQESVKEKLNVILTESRDKINPDMAKYIEGLNTEQPLMESKVTPKNESEITSFNNEDDKLIEGSIKEGNDSMETSVYTDKLESVIGELKGRYLTAESVIKEFVKERELADQTLKGVSDRYLTAEKACEGLRDYALKLEGAMNEVVALYNTSESVIANLRDRYNLSEQVIQNLTSRYTLSEQIIKELVNGQHMMEAIIENLRDRYTLSEACIKEFNLRYLTAESVISELVARNTLSEQIIAGLRDRLQAARKSNVSLKKRLGEMSGNTANADVEIKESEDKAELDQLREKCQVQEEVIDGLAAQIKESKETEVKPEVKKVPVPASYFESISKKYGISVEECKATFVALGSRKSAFEFHLEDVKKKMQNNYAEFPYMNTGRVATQVTESTDDVLESVIGSPMDRLSRLVESAF